MMEWQEDMRAMLTECGTEGKTTTFLFTDNQIKEEGQIEDINNMLNTGEIPNLYPPEDKADVVDKI